MTSLRSVTFVDVAANTATLLEPASGPASASNSIPSIVAADTVCSSSAYSAVLGATFGTLFVEYAQPEQSNPPYKLTFEVSLTGSGYVVAQMNTRPVDEADATPLPIDLNAFSFVPSPVRSLPVIPLTKTA